MPKVSLPLPEERVISVMTLRISSNAVPGSVAPRYRRSSAVNLIFDLNTKPSTVVIKMTPGNSERKKK